MDISMAEETRQRGKRKRVYSLDPHATLRATFSHNYLNYLLPAMLKLRTSSFQSFNTIAAAEEEEEEEEEEEGGRAKYYKMVKHQVDMALAVSAGTGFNWSHALKQKLDRDHIMKNVITSSLHEQITSSSTLLLPLRSKHNSLESDKQLHLLSPLLISMPPPAAIISTPPRPPFVLSGSHNSTSTRNSIIIGSKSTTGRKVRKRGRKREEDEEVGRRLETLRRILPGGNDMGSTKLLFSEVESYVICLELQVNILRTLVGTTRI